MRNDELDLAKTKHKALYRGWKEKISKPSSLTND